MNVVNVARQMIPIIIRNNVRRLHKEISSNPNDFRIFNDGDDATGSAESQAED